MARGSGGAFMSVFSRIRAAAKSWAYREALQHFDEQGYVIFRSAVSAELIERFWDRVESHIAGNDDLTLGLRGKLMKRGELEGEAYEARKLRITDIEVHEPLAPALFLHPVISGFLTARYGLRPTAIQTLTYKFSSEQGAHSDYHLVSPRSVGPDYDRASLAASWVACERADQGNGNLIIYPGSHRLAKKRLKEDFDGDYAAYRSYLEALCAANGIKPERFDADQGDILLWHGDFIHAGGPIRDEGRTRRSLVTHYCRLPAHLPSLHPERSRRETAEGWYFA